MSLPKKLKFNETEVLRGKTLVFPRTPLALLEAILGLRPKPRNPLKRLDRNFLYRFADFF